MDTMNPTRWKEAQVLVVLFDSPDTTSQDPA